MHYSIPSNASVVLPHSDEKYPSSGMMTTAEEVTLQTSEDVPGPDHRQVSTYQVLLFVLVKHVIYLKNRVLN